MSKYFFAVSTILMLLFFAAGCSNRAANILEDTTCQPPCWRGIHIGATKDEALNYLNKMPDISNGSITISGPRGDFYDEYVQWKFINNQGSGGFALVTGKVIEISFTLNPEVSASKMMSLYGEPDTLILEIANLDGVYMTLFLFYSQKGICLDMRPSYNPFIDPLKTYKITPPVRVEQIYFTDPSIYTDHSINDWEIKHGCLTGMDKKDYEKRLQKWTGYGKYKVTDLGVR
jgi:hypothetical protein